MSDLGMVICNLLWFLHLLNYSKMHTMYTRLNKIVRIGCWLVGLGGSARKASLCSTWPPILPQARLGFFTWWSGQNSKRMKNRSFKSSRCLGSELMHNSTFIWSMHFTQTQCSDEKSSSYMTKGHVYAHRMEGMSTFFF